MDTLQLELQVTGEGGAPLAGAVVWYVGGPPNAQRGTGLNAAAITRMAQRYFDQGDFLNVNDLPGAVFERTDLVGIYLDHRETGGLPDKRYPYIFVATKRGYSPQVVEGAAPLNERHTVKLQLRRDPQQMVDPRMEEFDRLLAQARTAAPGEDLTGEVRMRKLADLNQKVRVLAKTLEADGRFDDASAVYWALADFPDVVRINAPDGTTKIAGYRNGRSDTESEVDRAHATKLNTTVPKLLIGKSMMSQGFSRTGINDSIKGLAYLKAFEELASGAAREQLLPTQYWTAIYQALKWSTPDKACDLLQRAYRFEPTTMALEKWWDFIDDIDKRRKELKLSQSNCVIEGLVPRPKRSS